MALLVRGVQTVRSILEPDTDQMNKTLGASALFFSFLLVGGLWTTLLRVVPDGVPRTVVIITLGLVFNGIFLALVFRRVRSILAGDGRLWLQAGAVMAEVALLLAGFAAMHSQVGIMDTTLSGSPVVHDFWKGAYLSVVTFTTLGYGDMLPIGIGRALSAMQAFTGYIILGLLASSAASVVSPYTQAGPGEEADPD